jgi:hypothetical protein
LITFHRSSFERRKAYSGIGRRPDGDFPPKRAIGLLLHSGSRKSGRANPELRGIRPSLPEAKEYLD